MGRRSHHGVRGGIEAGGDRRRLPRRPRRGQARWPGGWDDGLITVSAEASKLEAMVAAFRDGGGQGKPIYLQVGLAYATSDGEALRDVHARWRQCVLPPSALADLPTPWAFD